MKHTGLRNLLIVSVAILLGMALAACGGGKYRSELLRAESILDSLPDSAREILKAIPRDTIDTREDLALRDLIAAEVQYKLYEDGPTGADTLAAAEETFRSAGDDKRLMRTLFQKGVRQFHAINYSESLVSALEALEIAEELRDYRYLGYTTRHLGDIYNHNYAFADALPYIRQSMVYFAKAGMSSHKMFAWANVAIDLSNLGCYEESLRTSDSIIALADPSENTLLSYVYEYRIRPNLKLGRIQEATRCVDLMNTYDGGAEYHNPELPILVAIKSGQLDKARSQIDSLKECQTSNATQLDICNLECEYHIAVGDTSSAFSLSDETARLEIDSLINIAKRGINGNQLDSRRMLASAKITDNIIHKHFTAICVLAFILLALLALLLLSLIKRKNNIQNIKEKEECIVSLLKELDNIQRILNEKDKRIESLKVDIEKKELSNPSEEGELRGELRKLFHGQFQAINSLCKDYYSKRDASAKVRLSLINDIETHIKALGAQTNIKEIESVLDKYYNGVATKLKQAVPELKSRDRTMLLLDMTGLSTKAICIICDLKDSGYYYSRRQQLKNKIATSSSPYANEIIAMLS